MWFDSKNKFQKVLKTEYLIRKFNHGKSSFKHFMIFNKCQLILLICNKTPINGKSVNTKVMYAGYMLKNGFYQDSLNVKLKDLFPSGEGNMLFLTKMVLGAVLLSGLVSISWSASFANATTNATTTDTNKIITGNKAI